MVVSMFATWVVATDGQPTEKQGTLQIARYSCYSVGSLIKDKDAKTEFLPSKNYPRPFSDEDLFGEQGKLSVVIDPDEKSREGRSDALRIKIVNRTSERATFAAIDSCLHLVQEAQNAEGKWSPIQRTTPGTGPRDCAVGAHRVFLEPGEYWQVSAPNFQGSFKTKIRFRLDQGLYQQKYPGGGGRILYSSEFEGSVDPELFR